MEFILKPKPPFDFQKMMRRLIGTGKTHVTLIGEDLNTYERVIRISGQKVYIRIHNKGTAPHPELSCYAQAIAGKANEQDVELAVRQMFSADIDLRSFYHQFQNSGYIGPIIQRFNGLRLVTDIDLFEAMLKIIIGQQVNLTFAGTLINRLIQLAGEEVEIDGKYFQVFPAAERVGALSYEQLRELQFSQRKAEYIIDFARLITEGKVSINELWEKTNEEVLEELLPIRGIGRWTIECLLIFAMGRCNVLPAADIGVRNAVRQVWKLSHQPTEEEVRDLALDWSPWETYITYYLWESLAKEPSILQNP